MKKKSMLFIVLALVIVFVMSVMLIGCDKKGKDEEKDSASEEFEGLNIKDIDSIRAYMNKVIESKNYTMITYYDSIDHYVMMNDGKFSSKNIIEGETDYEIEVFVDQTSRGYGHDYYYYDSTLDKWTFRCMFEAYNEASDRRLTDSVEGTLYFLNDYDYVYSEEKGSAWCEEYDMYFKIEDNMFCMVWGSTGEYMMKLYDVGKTTVELPTEYEDLNKYV